MHHEEEWNHRGVVANVLDCDIVVSSFDIQSHYCIHFRTNTFGKGMKPLIPPAMCKVASPLSFYKDGFGIKQTTKVDMPLNREHKLNL